VLIHDRFVFIHVPKTGGTFLRHMLKEELPDCYPLGEDDGRVHHGWDRIPDEAQGRPVLAFVRNPWDWYVSWYSFAVGIPPERFDQARMRPLYRRLFADESNGSGRPSPGNGRNPANDFAITVKRACTGIVDGGDPAELAPLVDGFDLAQPLLEGRDFYSARLQFTVGDAFDSELATIGRYESLLDDLEAFFEKIELKLPAGAMERIRAKERRNTSQHGHYRDYYDEELRDLVGSSCRGLIERFDYSF
jgi:hypothetical protein